MLGEATKKFIIVENHANKRNMVLTQTDKYKSIGMRVW